MTIQKSCDNPAVLRCFLAAHGLGTAVCQPLSGDASTRRYQRLHCPGRDPLILMQAPNPETELDPFITVAAMLWPLGLSVPKILAADRAAGLMLMEDFGDQTYAAVLDAGADPWPLYRVATDVLITLHRGFRPGHTGFRPGGPSVYNAGRFIEQVLLFPDMLFPGDTSRRAEFEEAWRVVIPAALAGPDSLLLRDYHAGNLMLLPGQSGVRACGLLDFQDAGDGPAAYDLVSLVEDARRDLDGGLVAALFEYYLSAFPNLDRAVFARACIVLAAIRHTRVIAVFLRLAGNGKPGYLQHLPRIWRYLERHLARPELAPVAAWFERYLPPSQRRCLYQRP
ncbi:MAG: phosphotransferase [Rhodospirillaceae bacterium]